MEESLAIYSSSKLGYEIDNEYAMTLNNNYEINYEIKC